MGRGRDRWPKTAVYVKEGGTRGLRYVAPGYRVTAVRTKQRRQIRAVESQCHFLSRGAIGHEQSDALTLVLYFYPGWIRQVSWRVRLRGCWNNFRWEAVNCPKIDVAKEVEKDGYIPERVDSWERREGGGWRGVLCQELCSCIYVFHHDCDFYFILNFNFWKSLVLFSDHKNNMYSLRNWKILKWK